MSLLKPAVPYPVKVLSVEALTKHIKEVVENDTLLSSVWVQGEISNLVKAASGHCYFTLKDDKAVLKACLWAGNRRYISTNFKNGDLVMVYGSISLYAPRGEYQIVVTDLRPAGIGALYEAYEKLKNKLQAEGLFDSERKLPLPFLPKGVGVVTSSTGAVIKDIFRVIRRRFKNMPIYLVPVKVQGEGAAQEIVTGIKRLNADSRVDVIIIARGGGSLEDLWAFNEEPVARAISDSRKPIISAVGHETDTTIADLVADKRAATPSVAGELVVPVKEDLEELIRQKTLRLSRMMKSIFTIQKQRYDNCAQCRFLVKPSLLVAERRNNIMNLSRELDTGFKTFIDNIKHRFELLNARFMVLDPKSLLRRGYIMATDEKGKVITSVKKLKKGLGLKLGFSDGYAGVTVDEVVKLSEGDK